MGQSTFRLDFCDDGSNFTLLRTVFTPETGAAITARLNDFPWRNGVIGLAVTMLRFRLGEPVVFGSPHTPERSLYYALVDHEDPLQWADAMFGTVPDPDPTAHDRPALRIHDLITAGLRTGVPHAGAKNKVVTLMLKESALPRANIHVTLNGHAVRDPGELVELRRKLTEEHAAQAARRCAARKPLQWDDALGAELAARYGTPDRPVQFHVVADGQDLAAHAAWVFHQKVKQLAPLCEKEVWIGVTGGVVQAEMAKHLPRIRPATDATAITVVPMNNMGRFEQPERSTAEVAQELGKSLHGDHRYTPAPERWTAFAGKLTVCLISGGERSRSYIAEEVRTAGRAETLLCPKAVGDINGHLLDEVGCAVKCPKVEKILRDRRLYNPLDPGTLRTLAGDPHRSVIAVLSDRGLGPAGADEAGASKCPLALACLRGGYANVYVIGAGLARELLAVPRTTSLTVRRRVV